MENFRTINKKQLAARVLCALLLGTYLTGGYQPPVRADALNVYGNTNITVDSGRFASAWGYGSDDYSVTATGLAATAFGWGTKAEGDLATSFGQITAAYGGASTAFGWNSKAYGTASTAFGNSSETYGYGTTAFGSSSQAFGDYSTAFGEYTKAFGEDSTAFGYKTQAGRLLYGTTEALIRRYKEGDEYKYKIVDANTSETLKDGFATYKDAYGDSSLTRKGDYATAWGNNTKAIGEAAAAFGIGTTASGNHSTAFGFSTTAGGDDSTAFGAGTTASGDDSTAFGYQSEASGDDSTAFGIQTIASGNGATAWGGYYNSPTDYQNGGKADGLASTAFGIKTEASGTASTAFGYVGTKESGYDAPSIKAAEIGTTAYGYATLGGAISAEGGGDTAFGSATMGGKISAGTGGGANDKEGATAFGRAYGKNGQILAAESGATAFGAASDGAIKAEEWGATAFGRTYDDGTISASGRGATAFGYAEKGGSISASGYGATAFGYAEKGGSISASGYGATAFGIQSTASGEAATAWGNKSVADGKYSTAFGDSSQALAENSLAALGGITETAATNSAAIGKGATVKVADAVALGSGSVASREAGATDAYLKTDSDTGNAWVSTHNAIAVGDDGNVTRQITGVAAGSKDADAVNVAQLKKVAAGAVYTAGDGVSIADNKISVKADTKDFTFDSGTLTLKKDGKVESGNTGVVTGGTVYKALQSQSAAIDGKANKSLDNITDSGKTVVRDLAKEAVKVVGGTNTTVTDGTDGNAKTYAVNVVTNGTIASGDTGIVTGGTVFTETRVSSDGNYIKEAGSAADNLTALDTQVKKNEDAVGTTADGNYVKASNSVGENLGALDAEIAALAGGAGAGIDELSRRISNVDSKVEKVGAGAAALAALHPMDTDGKFSAAAGFGNYRSANAMALGLFYRPNDQVLFSMGGSMGNGENLLNVGVSFALDKGVSTSKAAMARKIVSLTEENAQQAAKIETLEARLAALEAKLGK